MGDRDGPRVSELLLGEDRFLVVSVPTDLDPSIADALTQAEVEVVVSCLDGASNAAIAARRSTSVKTVANQLASAYEKLGVSSRTELQALIARRQLQRRG